jgi:hypothetical protein
VLTVQGLPRNYSGTASVGDFLNISIDPNQGTLAYTDVSNGAGGTVSYVVNANGSATLDDPAGHLLSVSEVPGYGIVALMNNAGTAKDELALVTSVGQQNVTAASFEGRAYNMMEVRTRGGGVGVASLAIDGAGSISGLQYMPFNQLGGSGFNALTFALPPVSPSPYYLLLHDNPPPDGSGNNYIFGVPNGMFVDDNEDGSMIGLPKASAAVFNSAWANTYKLTYYQKTNAYGPDGNSPEAGDVAWGVATVTLDSSGNLSMTDGQGNTMASGLLVPVANTPSLYDGTTGDELGDPCYGLFTLTNTGGGTQQQVFVAFTDGAVMLSRFSTSTPFNPGDDYNYFYGVGLPQATAATASNDGNSRNPGGSSTANAAGAWNSLAGAYSSSPTAPRVYIGSSTTGDLLSMTIDPTAGTLTYYDYTNGNRSSNAISIAYTLNSDGSSTVSDPATHVLAALELPDQALFLEMNNTGFNIPNPAPPTLVVAVPEMNLTTVDFASQSYNFMQLRNTMGDETIGSMAIDAGGNFSGDG